MLLADSRLPAGAHVSSNGLEAALRRGLAPEKVGDYLRSRLGTVVPVEAGTAAVARMISLHGLQDTHDLHSKHDPNDQHSKHDPHDQHAAESVTASGASALPTGSSARVEELRREWAARTPSRAQREIACALGDGLRRLAAEVWPDALAVLGPTVVGRRPVGGHPTVGLPRPIVLGAIAAAAGLGAADLVRLVAYDDAQTVASAWLKLEPSDPRRAAHLVLEACATFELQVPHLAALESPEHIPCTGAPLTEEWAEAQSQLPRRLFRA